MRGHSSIQLGCCANDKLLRYSSTRLCEHHQHVVCRCFEIIGSTLGPADAGLGDSFAANTILRELADGLAAAFYANLHHYGLAGVAADMSLQA